MFTFKKFLSIIQEDANVDKMVMDIQTAISQLDTQINQRTQPLVAQKQNLQKRLVPLLKKKEQDDQRAGKEQQINQQQQQQQQNMQQPGSNTTTTPGSTGSATPGGGASTIQGR
jgi:DNA-binding helix-hairpin-helix protein with protein kinase domain